MFYSDVISLAPLRTIRGCVSFSLPDCVPDVILVSSVSRSCIFGCVFCFLLVFSVAAPGDISDVAPMILPSVCIFCTFRCEFVWISHLSGYVSGIGR